MPIPAFITGPLIDLAKKELLKIGKKVAHQFIDSATGVNIGEIICYRKEEGYNNVLLFVHGFSGNSGETFGATPELIVNNPEFNGWDVYSIGYSSDIFPSIGKGLWSVNPDITKVSFYLKTLLLNQFSDYNRIAFVAHSMGGLAVQRAILDMDDAVVDKIKHVIFFGTPSAGLKKAYWFRFWNTQVRDLDHKSKFIGKLREDWKNKYPGEYGFIFKTIAGSKDEFVTVDSSLHPFDVKYQGVIEGNHINMIKPKDPNNQEHQSYQIILKTLKNQNEEYLKGDPEEVNILLGEYQEVINKYYAKAKEIGTRELTQLVFALECNGRQGDALKVLHEHPKSASNSDIMGIIGGRFKRKYLLEGLQADLDKSFEYYTKAYQMALEKQDQKQIFYHAINLAFLSLISGNGQNDMQKFARIALDNCCSPNRDMWEVATIAEANLYLGNQDEAEKYYREAGNIAGTDIRAKQSIYSNAYYGYQSLTSSTNTDAAFIKMLEEVFLDN